MSSSGFTIEWNEEHPDEAISVSIYSDEGMTRKEMSALQEAAACAIEARSKGKS